MPFVFSALFIHIPLNKLTLPSCLAHLMGASPHANKNRNNTARREKWQRFYGYYDMNTGISFFTLSKQSKRPPQLDSNHSLFYFIYIYRLHRVFMASHELSLVAASGGYSSCTGFSLQWLILWIPGSRAFGLQQLGCMGLVTSRLVESSRTRDQTCVPCIGRWILNHLTTRKVLFYTFSMVKIHD